MNKFWKKFDAVDGEGGDLGGAPAGGTESGTAADGSFVESPVQDWNDMASDDEGGGGVGTVPAAEPSAPAPAAAPATPPAAITPAPVAPAQTPAAQPVVPATEGTQQQAQQQQPEQQVDVATLRKNYEDQLTQYYAIDPQTALQLQTEPELVLPKLAARVHLEVLDAVMGQLGSRVGQAIQQFTVAKEREDKASSEFFGAFPDLKEHKDAVLRVGAMFRAANPKATKEQAVKAIGEFVRQSLGLQAPAPVAPPPSAPANPFIPAAGNGGGAVTPPKSEWDFILDEDS